MKSEIQLELSEGISILKVIVSYESGAVLIIRDEAERGCGVRCTLDLNLFNNQQLIPLRRADP